MNNLHFIIPIAILLIVLSLLIVFHFKKKSVIKKVHTLRPSQKKNILDNLAKTVGYFYDPCQDIFVARHDAPQKVFGYTLFYDFSAPYFNMVFDYETIYFDYNGRTWLIEMWKGQYGINSGCELGIYYADNIVPPCEYSTTHFQAVDTSDMLDISLWLNRHPGLKARRNKQPSALKTKYQTRLGRMKSRHWWLTIFRMGTFSKPKELSVNTSIRFHNAPMLHQFLDSFRETLPHTKYKVNGLTVYFTFSHSSREYNVFKKTVRCIALFFCNAYCKLFNYITRPFEQSGDKLLYLYYYVPFTVRLLFKPKKSK